MEGSWNLGTERKYDIFLILNLEFNSTINHHKKKKKKKNYHNPNFWGQINCLGLHMYHPHSYSSNDEEEITLYWTDYPAEWHLLKEQISYWMRNWKLKYTRLYFPHHVLKQFSDYGYFGSKIRNNLKKNSCFFPIFF